MDGPRAGPGDGELEGPARERVLGGMAEAERKAWRALAGYKFWMFGYWAGIWVHLNRLGGFHRPSPFRKLVDLARNVKSPEGPEEAEW